MDWSDSPARDRFVCPVVPARRPLIVTAAAQGLRPVFPSTHESTPSTRLSAGSLDRLVSEATYSRCPTAVAREDQPGSSRSSAARRLHVVPAGRHRYPVSPAGPRPWGITVPSPLQPWLRPASRTPGTMPPACGACRQRASTPALPRIQADRLRNEFTNGMTERRPLRSSLRNKGHRNGRRWGPTDQGCGTRDDRAAAPFSQNTFTTRDGVLPPRRSHRGKPAQARDHQFGVRMTPASYAPHAGRAVHPRIAGRHFQAS